MSEFEELFGAEGGGAPISPSRAGDIEPTVDQGKINFQNSATPRHEKIIKNQKSAPIVLPPVVKKMPDNEYNRLKHKGSDSNDKKMSQVVEWRPNWANPKKPHAKGIAANRAELKAIDEAMEVGKPAVRDDWVLPDSGISEEMLEEVFTYIAAGGTLTTYCAKTHLPYKRLWNLLNRDPEIKRRYQEARRTSVDAIADEALRIASEPAWQDDVVETYDEEGKMRQRAVKRYDNVYARKLAFQSRQWLLSKIAPEKYGEKPQTGDTDSRAARILAARKRLAAEVKAAEKA